MFRRNSQRANLRHVVCAPDVIRIMRGGDGGGSGSTHSRPAGQPTIRQVRGRRSGAGDICPLSLPRKWALTNCTAAARECNLGLTGEGLKLTRLVRSLVVVTKFATQSE